MPHQTHIILIAVRASRPTSKREKKNEKKITYCVTACTLHLMHMWGPNVVRRDLLTSHTRAINPRIRCIRLIVFSVYGRLCHIAVRHRSGHDTERVTVGEKTNQGEGRIYHFRASLVRDPRLYDHTNTHKHTHTHTQIETPPSRTADSLTYPRTNGRNRCSHDCTINFFFFLYI